MTKKISLKENFDFTQANYYLSVVNFPFIIPSHIADFESFKAFLGNYEYQGKSDDENIKIAFAYCLYVNELRNNRTGYIPAFMLKLIDGSFTTTAGQSL